MMYLTLLLQATICSKPLEVFQVLEAKGLCNELAGYYENWASAMEDTGNMKKADIIYQQGLTNAKDSKVLLQDAHKLVSTPCKVFILVCMFCHVGYTFISLVCYRRVPLSVAVSFIGHVSIRHTHLVGQLT